MIPAAEELANKSARTDFFSYSFTMSFGQGGRNPRYGQDAGPPPPTSQQSFGGYASGFPHQYGALPQQYGALPPFNAANFFNHQPRQSFNYGAGFAPMGQQTFLPGATAFASQAGPGTGQVPGPQPVINSSLPAVNMTNSTGGVGCEPGYNYFFPSEHCKMLVFRTGDTAPWNLPAHFAVDFHAIHVPVNTTIGDLLMGLGATNPNPRKNKVFEIHQGGNGRWYRGLCYSGDDEKEIEMQIKEVGWDKTRTGKPGGKPVVYLYIVNG